MRGIILAGGNGTRLKPLTDVTNKHLLPVYDKPMIFYPIETLKRGGIDEILVVVGGNHAGHFMRVLKNGEDFGVKIQYAYQQGAGGIADALSLAEDFADKEPICVILGDNTTDYDISDDIKDFGCGAKIFVKRVPDPERFGVADFDEDGKIISIEEKPDYPQTDYAVTGLYMYDHWCFDLIKDLSPSKRGEMEITDLNNCYLETGDMHVAHLDSFWKDAGTPRTLFEASKYWAGKAANEKTAA